MVSGSLALPYFLFGFHGGRQGSGPDRGQSPVEWGDFPYVRSFVCMYVHTSPPLGHPARPEAQRGERMDGRTDIRTYGKSPHSKGLVPYRGSCPASPHENQGSRAGQGNRWLYAVPPTNPPPRPTRHRGHVPRPQGNKAFTRPTVTKSHEFC